MNRRKRLGKAASLLIYFHSHLTAPKDGVWVPDTTAALFRLQVNKNVALVSDGIKCYHNLDLEIYVMILRSITNII